MDIFAHGLWSYAALHKDPHAKTAIVVGMLPDIIPFAPILISRVIKGTFKFSAPPHNPGDIPGIAYQVYDITHSFITILVVFALIAILTRKFYLFLLAWPLHILLDIPTHTSEFFPTHFLYPLSSFHVSGISWGRPWFMLLNYSALLIVYLFLIFA